MSGPPEPALGADGSSAIRFVIFDVDGVLLASPHERAWRDALRGFADPDRFTTALYQAQVAGKPRQDGAIAALRALGVADADTKAPAYAAAKQERLEALVREGRVEAYPDGVRFVSALRALGLPLAVASSSKNANAMLRSIKAGAGGSLYDMFDANDCGRDLARGKPDPEIFLLAAELLGAEARHCLVVEDAPAGIEAARAAGMWALGVARLHDEDGLRAAGANLVVTTLDQVSIADLRAGRLAPTIADAPE